MFSYRGYCIHVFFLTKHFVYCIVILLQVHVLCLDVEIVWTQLIKAFWFKPLPFLYTSVRRKGEWFESDSRAQLSFRVHVLITVQYHSAIELIKELMEYEVSDTILQKLVSLLRPSKEETVKRPEILEGKSIVI